MRAGGPPGPWLAELNPASSPRARGACVVCEGPPGEAQKTALFDARCYSRARTHTLARPRSPVWAQCVGALRALAARPHESDHDRPRCVSVARVRCSCRPCGFSRARTRRDLQGLACQRSPLAAQRSATGRVVFSLRHRASAPPDPPPTSARDLAADAQGRNMHAPVLCSRWLARQSLGGLARFVQAAALQSCQRLRSNVDGDVRRGAATGGDASHVLPICRTPLWQWLPDRCQGRVRDCDRVWAQ